MADMAEVWKKLEEELEEINNSLQQKEDTTTIVSISYLIENDVKLPTGNTAIKLINIVKELYKLANKAITHAKPDDAAPNGSPTMDLVKEELALGYCLVSSRRAWLVPTSHSRALQLGR